MIRIYRKSTGSFLTLGFSDVGVKYEMSDKAIQSHVNSFYFGWELVSVKCGEKFRILA